MDNKDLQFRLLAGMPIPFEKGFIYSPKLREIAEIGYNKYYDLLSVLLIDKSNVEMSQDYDLTNFEILFHLSYQDKEFGDKLFQAFDLFLKEFPRRQYDENGVLFLFENWSLNNENFDQFQSLIELSNCVTTKPEKKYKFANKKAKELFDRLLKEFPTPKSFKKKNEITLFGIVNALAWRNNGMNIKEIFDLNVFQIYQAFLTTENIDNYMSTIHGIYAGTVDINKINIQKIHWAKEIDLQGGI